MCLYLGTIGCTRINLIPYDVGFMVTPPFFLSLVILVLGLKDAFQIGIIHSLRLPAILTTILIFWCLITGALGEDPVISIRKIILLTIVVFSAFASFLCFETSKNKKAIFKISLIIFLTIYISFSLTQGVIFYGYPELGTAKDDTEIQFINLLPKTFAYFAPRISGCFLDPNIAGYCLIFIYTLNKNFGWFKIVNPLIFVLVIMTISRSSIATIILVDFIFFFRNISAKKILTFFMRGILFLGVGFLILEKLEIFEITKALYNIQEAFSLRLEGDESSSIHNEIMLRGISLAIDNPFNFIRGYGFGTSYLFLTDIFGSTKYGNFHSEFLTIAIETGLIGLTIYLAICFTPAIKAIITFKNKPTLILSLVLILSNIYYQQFMFHYYWLVLVGCWYFTHPKTQKNGLC